MKKLLVFCFCAFLLAGCSSKYATNGENLYLASYNGSDLQIPSPLTRANISFFYKLPEQTNSDLDVDIMPPTINA